MPDELRLILAFGLALCAAFVATPLAMSVATRTGFHDDPVGYKRHARPTPYLGGAAVLGGFLIGAITIGGEFARLSPIVVCAFVLWALGTLDDRVGLAAWPRLVAEAVVAIVLWSAGLGWDVMGDVGDLVLTIFWVVALVNAYNLIDNMDGAAATLASVTGVTIGVLALIEGDAPLAILMFGLAGACTGFLPYNLAAPARIFLGDGGSLPIGFVIAAALMVLPGAEELGIEPVLAAVLLAGLPLVDTALVTVSRRRAGISLVTGGRDHLTHRLQTRLGTARAVALTLGVTQAGLGAVAIGVVQLGRGSVVVAWSIWFVVATATIVLLETASWVPMRSEATTPKPDVANRRERGPAVPSAVEVLVIAFVSVSCGLSPFLYGFYDLSVWGPIALGVLAALLGLLIARPVRPRREALVAAAALALLCLWALVSTAWAESADQAMTDANRWLLYAALFGLLMLLLRDDRLASVLIGAGTAAIAALGGYLLVRMLAGSASELFVAGRLHEPLGYVNAQAGYLLLGVWPLVAIAERARNALVAGAAVAGATALAALVLLGQTRAVLPAVAVAVVLLLVVVPGRARRGWVLVFVTVGLAACMTPVLDVYESVGRSGRPGDAILREAAVAMLFASALAGALWAGVSFGAERVAWRWPRAGRLAAPPLLALAAVAAGLALGAVNDPLGKVRDEYRAFTQLEPSSAGAPRFTTGSGNRYDYWRIAWDQFEQHPVSGVGAGNYDSTYFLERRTTENVRQAHSIELQALGELGLVGAGLLALFVCAVLVGLWRRSRAARDDPQQAALAVAAGGSFLVWLVQTSVDWLHLIPGLTGLALAGAVVLVGPSTPWRGSRARPIRPVLLLLLLAGGAVAIGAVLIGRAALAEHYREQGQRALARDPVRALERSEQSLALNDEALPTYYLKSAAWARLGEYHRARAALSDATHREPHDFLPWVLLGDLATRRGDHGAASRDYARAQRLNPQDHTVAASATRARGRARAAR